MEAELITALRARPSIGRGEPAKGAHVARAAYEVASTAIRLIPHEWNYEKRRRGRARDPERYDAMRAAYMRGYRAQHPEYLAAELERKRAARRSWPSSQPGHRSQQNG